MTLEVRVIPNAPATAITGIRDGRYVLRVHAPARDGKANRAAIEYLARLSGVPRSRVRLVSGEKARHKKFEIVGLDAGREEALLAGILDNTSRANP